MKQPDSLTTRALVKRCESYAAQIRGLMSVLRTGPVNPFDSLEALQVEVVPSKLVAVGAEENAFEATFQMSAKQWSGVSAPLPDGRLLVMLNPNQTEERARVTLLEEVAHRFLGHSLHKIGQGKRDSYDEAQEKEAYFTAAAVLLPQFDLARALYDGESVGAIAARFGVSSELVEMRIKINNLWHHRTL